MESLIGSRYVSFLSSLAQNKIPQIFIEKKEQTAMTMATYSHGQGTSNNIIVVVIIIISFYSIAIVIIINISNVAGEYWWTYAQWGDVYFYGPLT